MQFHFGVFVSVKCSTKRNPFIHIYNLCAPSEQQTNFIFIFIISWQICISNDSFSMFIWFVRMNATWLTIQHSLDHSHCFVHVAYRFEIEMSYRCILISLKWTSTMESNVIQMHICWAYQPTYDYDCNQYVYPTAYGINK